MSQLKKLLSQTAIYGLSSIVGRVLNYLMVPIYTSVFKPGEYGVVTDFYAWVAFFNVIYLFGLETTYFRFVNKRKDQSKKVFGDLQSLIICIAFFITAILVLNADWIANAFGYPGKSNYIYMLAAVMLIDAIVAIPFAKLRHEGKAVRFASTKLINIALVILLNLFFIVWCPALEANGYQGFLLNFYDPKYGVGYVFVANLLANAIYLLLMGDLLVSMKFKLPINELKNFFLYATPIMFLGLAGVTNEMLSRAILKYRLPVNFYDGLTNLDVLGIFGACYKLSVFMALAIQAFKYAAEPFFFKSAEKKDSPILFAKVMTGYVIFACILLMAVVLNLDWISALFLRNDVYLQALPTVPWLLLGGLFLGVYYNLSIWFKITEKTKFGAYISGIGALLTITLNWILIPFYGYMASAFVTAFIYFLMSVISYYYGQKYFVIPYELKKGGLYVFTIFLISLTLFYYPLASGIFKIIYNNTIILVIIFVILKIEKVNFQSIIGNRRK